MTDKVMKIWPLEIPEELRDEVRSVTLSNIGVVIVDFAKPRVLRQVHAESMGDLFSMPVAIGQRVELHTSALMEPDPEWNDTVKRMVAAAMKGREKAPDEPKWTFSSNEEHWSESTDFATREEALAEAKGTLDLEVGQIFFTGRTAWVEPKDLADAASDGERIIERMEEHLYENLSDELDTSITTTPAQTDELEALVAHAITGWLVKHGLTPKLYQLEEVKKHVVTAVTPEGLVIDE